MMPTSAIDLGFMTQIVTLTRKHAADIANAPVGERIYFSILVVFGGIVFNIGNIASVGLWFKCHTRNRPENGGGCISAVIAIILFSSKRAGIAVDRIMIALELLMVAMTLYVVFISNPPPGDAFRQTMLPDDFTTITIIVGGTIGGYIT